MSGATIRGMALILNKVSILWRMAWTKWKGSEVTGRIGWEVGGVSLDEPFPEVHRR